MIDNDDTDGKEDGQDEIPAEGFRTKGTVLKYEWSDYDPERNPIGQEIEVQLADGTLIIFRCGSFFRLRDNGQEVKHTLIAQLPLIIHRPRCRTRETMNHPSPVPVYDSYRFSFVYDGSPGETASVDELMRVISAGGRMSTTSRMHIYAFFVVLQSWTLSEREFEEYHDEIETDGFRIAVNANTPFEKETLETINELSSVVTHPNAFAGLLSYLSVYPFSYELRQNGILTPIPLLEGTSQSGKSRMAELIVCRGFNQPDAFKTMESVRTQHSLNWTMEQGRYPFVVDDIDMQFVSRFSGFMRSAVSGTGESQRVNLTAKGISVKHAKRLPVLTTNSIDELPEEMRNRFLQWRFGAAELGRVDKQRYFDLAEKLPENFMMVFLRSFHLQGIDALVNRLKDGNNTGDLKERYLALGYSAVKDAYERNHVPCRIPPPVLREDLTTEWNDVFRSWLSGWYSASIRDNGDRYRPSAWVEKLMEDIDYIDDANWAVTVRGYREFCKEYRDCHYSARAFAEKYGYRYMAVRIHGGRTVKGIMAKSDAASDSTSKIDSFK